MTHRVDAHHHLWDPSEREQPWITGEAMAPLRRRFDVADLAAAATAGGITHTVVVHTVADVAETQELLDRAAAAPLISGVVGYVDLTAPDVGEQLDRLQEGPGGDRLVGIRNLVQDERDPAWLLRPAVLHGLRQVAVRDLAYDLLIRPAQMGAASGAAAEVPDGRFVLDHLAKPGIAAGEWEPWASALRALASRANVWCKLSGMVTEADWQAWSTDDLRPYADLALAQFGPERLMFGSDWPVCTLAAPYDVVVEVAEALLADLAAEEQAAVFGGTATDVYRLRHRAPTGLAMGDGSTVP